MLFWGSGVKFVPSKDIPSLEGKEILVTGGNIGLGKQSCLELSRHHPKRLYLAARSQTKAEDAIAEIKKQVPDAAVEFLQLDLGSFASIKSAAKKVLETSDHLDILLLNAGVMAAPAALTDSGYELQFGTNHVGHALLTKLLMPLLLKTADLPGSDVRVVALSSYGHNFAPKEGILFDKVKTNLEDIGTWTRYGQSKLANILFAKGLAKRYPKITATAVHPGAVRTNLTHSMTDSRPWLKPVETVFSYAFFVSVEEGAKDQLWAATAKDVKTGEYYEPVGVLNRGSALSNDMELSDRLWEWTEKELEGQELKA